MNMVKALGLIWDDSRTVRAYAASLLQAIDRYMFELLRPIFWGD